MEIENVQRVECDVTRKNGDRFLECEARVRDSGYKNTEFRAEGFTLFSADFKSRADGKFEKDDISLYPFPDHDGSVKCQHTRPGAEKNSPVKCEKVRNSL